MKKTMSKALFSLALMGATASSGTALADIMIIDGLEGGSGDVQNVLFNDLNSNDIGLTIDGFLNQDGDIVLFTGTEPLTTPSGGQARIVGEDGTFTHLTFRLQDPTMGFDKVQFNIDAVDDGEINLVFTDQFNTDWSGTFDLDGSGENFFTAIASNNQLISAVTLDSSVSIALSDLAQVRLNPSPITTTGVVPEPATLMLLGAGMVGLGFMASRKKRSKL